MSIPRFFTRQPVLVNMLMLAILVAGLLSLNRMALEENPSIDMDSVVVIIQYPGATPEDVEKLITLPIEDRISGLPDIDYIYATSYEGRSVFFVQYEVGLDDFDQAVLDLKGEVDKAKPDIPEEARDNIIFFKIATGEIWPILGIGLGGDYSVEGLNQIAESLKEEILNVDDVGAVEIYGVRNREIWVEADRSKLDNFNLSLPEISNAIQMANINLPAGRLEMGREEFLVRPMGELDDPKAIGRVIVRPGADGSTIRVDDVAEIIDSYERNEIVSRLDGQSSVFVRVFMREDGSVVDIVDDVREVIADYQKRMPDVTMTVRHDASKDVRESIDVLTINALTGLVLVSILMTLAIGLRSAILAVIGIPFAFMSAFIFLYASGGTINTLSLFAFILVLGMIVDDAIIIIENVYRHMEEGKPPLLAAIEGSEQVMFPVISAVLTTVAAFLPLLLMEGVIGKFLAVLPVVVTLALLGSLIQSLVVLPSHLADFGKLKKEKSYKSLPGRLYEKMLLIYKKQLIFFLDHKYIVTLGTIIITIISISVAVKMLRVEMFPKDASSSERLLVRMPVGTKLEITDEALNKIYERINTLPAGEVVSVSTLAGLIVENQRWIRRSDGGMVTIELGDPDERRDNDAIKDNIRDLISNIPEIDSAYFTQGAHGPPTGSPVELRVRGDNIERMHDLAQMIVDDIASVKGIKDAKLDFDYGKKEVRFFPDRVKMSLYGLTMVQLATLMRTAVEGWEATKFRDTEGDEVKVRVILKESDRDSIEDIRRLSVVTPTGIKVPLSELGEIKIERGAASISRKDGKRAITITADVNYVDINSDEANNYIKTKYADFATRYPGFNLEFGGEAQEQAESFQSLLQAFLVAIIVIYLILGTQFKSFLQPIIVLFTVPFSMLGVSIGLIVSGLNFSLVAGISIVSLSGVVVNDSLVLVDFINKARATGIKRRNALVLSGQRRMRPILLTTITTVAGLTPMAFGFGGASKTWQPMAICMCWGLMFATFLTLFIIPTTYAILDNWINRVRRKLNMKTTDEKLVEMAKDLQDDTVTVDLDENGVKQN